jgi:hypothetical protein
LSLKQQLKHVNQKERIRAYSDEKLGKNFMGEALKRPSIEDLRINSIVISEQDITAKISDGRTVCIPLAWFPRLVNATEKQIKNFELSPSGYGIHWPDLDEDISIKSFINP